MNEEQKSAPAREELRKILGNPLEWPSVMPPEFMFLPCCPHCGAATINPYQHKAWHLQSAL